MVLFLNFSFLNWISQLSHIKYLSNCPHVARWTYSRAYTQNIFRALLTTTMGGSPGEEPVMYEKRKKG